VFDRGASCFVGTANSFAANPRRIHIGTDSNIGPGTSEFSIQIASQLGYQILGSHIINIGPNWKNYTLCCMGNLDDIVCMRTFVFLLYIVASYRETGHHGMF
jgi:hypothetical protein